MKLILILSLFLTSTVFAADPYHEVASYKLGGDGGWDLLASDGASSRLYVARANRIMVIDASSGKLVGEIPGMEGAHGVALAVKHGRGFATAGKLGQVWSFDLKTLKVDEKIAAGQNPDAILYDPFTDRVFAFNGKSHDITVIDAATNKVLGTISVGGKLELGVSDGAGKIFVNVEDKSEIVVVDSQKLKVLKHFPLAPCEEPTGIARSSVTHRLFAGCDNKMAAVVDEKTGKVLQTVPVGEGVDGAAFDSKSKTAFFPAGESGKLSLFRETKKGLEPLQEIVTQKSARTIALDSESGNTYLPAAEFGPAPALAPGQKKSRPPVVPGSFRIIVIGK